jgi:hypothetical protein
MTSPDTGEDEKSKTKTPDFLVQYSNGSAEYIEVHWSVP